MGYYINIYHHISRKWQIVAGDDHRRSPRDSFGTPEIFTVFPRKVAPTFGTPTAKLANFAGRISMHIDAYWCILHVISRKGLILAKFEWSRHVAVMFFLVSDCSFGTKLHPIGICLKGQGNCRKLVKPIMTSSEVTPKSSAGETVYSQTIKSCGSTWSV